MGNLLLVKDGLCGAALSSSSTTAELSMSKTSLSSCRLFRRKGAVDDVENVRGSEKDE